VGKKTPEKSVEVVASRMPNGSPRLKTIAKLADRMPTEASTSVVMMRKRKASRKFP
jgi:hypothetical protein